MTGFLNASLSPSFLPSSLSLSRWRKKIRNEKKEKITDLAPRWNQRKKKNFDKNYKRKELKNITCSHVALSLLDGSSEWVSERKRINSISLYTESSNTKSIILALVPCWSFSRIEFYFSPSFYRLLYRLLRLLLLLFGASEWNMTL